MGLDTLWTFLFLNGLFDSFKAYDLWDYSNDSWIETAGVPEKGYLIAVLIAVPILSLDILPCSCSLFYYWNLL